MSRKDNPGQGGAWSAIVLVLGVGCILAAGALVSFELGTHSRNAKGKHGAGAGAEGIVAMAIASDRDLEREMGGPYPSQGGRSPFKPVPKPVKPKPYVPPKPVPKPVPVVNALVLGGRPEAVVTYQGKELTVSVGSRIDDLTVTKIDSDGLHLSGRGPEMVLRPH